MTERFMHKVLGTLVTTLMLALCALPVKGQEEEYKMALETIEKARKEV